MAMACSGFCVGSVVCGICVEIIRNKVGGSSGYLRSDGRELPAIRK